ncbi:hypothetical protein ACIG87_24445 [Micromonospora sp. NPDC051925]|uniref:hypothetical protein n=1 Tax=Micromonospora sp. NPDC051925 TaxID=3364288 RepID=UPI0037C8CCBD
MMPTSRALIAGAAGASALNAVTYLDMAVRARPASSAAEDSVGRLADLARVDLGDQRTGENRRSGLGPLLGYATSVAAAAVFAAAGGRRLPVVGAALALTGLAMIGSNGPLTVLKVTDPRSWSTTDWLTDLIPHLAYGAVTAVTLQALR